MNFYKLDSDWSYQTLMPTLQQSIDLVKYKILWTRKGTEDIPSYLHSLRVNEALKKYKFNEDTQIAGLLHDIIEDGWMTFDELKDLGYSDEILHLVDLASHDITITNAFQRREKMIKRLIAEKNKNARAIKVADISDNLLECHLMPNKQRLGIFLNKKCPVFVYYGNKYFGGTEFYDEFVQRYFKQKKDYHAVLQ